MRGIEVAASGRVALSVDRQSLWPLLFQPEILQRVIPGAKSVTQLSENSFEADLSLGVGRRFSSRYTVHLDLMDIQPDHSFKAAGEARGSLGGGTAEGWIRLEETPTGCNLDWQYKGVVTGTVTRAGRLAVRFASRLFLSRLFIQLGKEVTRDAIGTAR
ncbi:MAG: hypothetical protein Alpg2KO_14130 [Alphaproteobacteria bacterium]